MHSVNLIAQFFSKRIPVIAQLRERPCASDISFIPRVNLSIANRMRLTLAILARTVRARSYRTKRRFATNLNYSVDGRLKNFWKTVEVTGPLSA